MDCMDTGMVIMFQIVKKKWGKKDKSTNSSAKLSKKLALWSSLGISFGTFKLSWGFNISFLF
jgi:hypothetical protein